MLTPEDLFDLTGFPHGELFEGLNEVWRALDRLPGFLETWGDWRLLGEVAPGACISGKVFLGHGSVVEPWAFIEGPTVIGNGCRVRHGAYLRGTVLMGDECVVGHCAELKSAILLDGAKAPHFNYVGDTILGANVNLGAGTVCANLRLDEGEVFAGGGRTGYPRIGTGRRKLGALVGDGARTGCKVVLNPRTVIPKGALVRTMHAPSTAMMSAPGPRSRVMSPAPLSMSVRK